MKTDMEETVIMPENSMATPIHAPVLVLF